MDLFYSIIGFILAISILVVIHEFGHFYIARLFKVKVLRFSIGFGPSRVIWQDKLGTQYLISAIPLGGYIQPLDTSDPKNMVPESEQHMAINNKSPWIRIAILLAGSLFNIFLAVILYWLVFIIGISTVVPIVGAVPKGTVADLAKLTSGLQIKKIAATNVNSWEDVATNLMKQVAAKNSFVPVEAYDHKTSNKSIHVLNLTNWTMNSNKGDVLTSLGLAPLKLVDARIWKVLPDYPAAIAGIKEGDLIVSIDNILIRNASEVSEYLHDKVGKKVIIELERNGEILSFNLAPVVKEPKDLKNDNTDAGGVIGIQYRNKPYPKELTTIERYGLVDSFCQSITKTYNNILLSGYLLYSTFTGKLSLSNAAGPVAIGYYAGQSIKNGLEYFLNFLGLVSINLGILNLLPIPWLDGGSIVHCFYEILTRRSAPQKIINFARTISLSLLIILAIFIVINDIARL